MGGAEVRMGRSGDDGATASELGLISIPFSIFLAGIPVEYYQQQVILPRSSVHMVYTESFESFPFREDASR
jgi:hypothetical protein